MERLREDEIYAAPLDAADAERLAPTQPAALPTGVVPFARPRAAASAVYAKGALWIMTLAETFVIVLMSIVAGVGYHAVFWGTQGNLLAFLAVGLLASIFFCGAMRTIESNQRLRRLNGPEAIRDVTLVWLAAMAGVTFFAFSLKAGGALSRGSIMTFLVFGWVGLAATRAIVPSFLLKHYRPARLLAHQVIVVGAEGDPALDLLLIELTSAGYAAPRIVRFNARCAAREWQRELPEGMIRVLGLARTAAHGEVCIAAGGFTDDRLKDIVHGLQVVPRAVRIIPSPAVEQWLHYPIRSVGGLHSVELQKAPLSVVEVAVKRAMDVVLASLALLFVSPLFALVAIATKLDSKGPVLFKQTRLGHRSVPFAIYKFRTMTVTENGSDVKQAEANDRRVTRIGRWLRKTSVDELPQLINVIRGEMSLVGPRPHAIAHDQYYATLIDNYEVRQHVKPGITGWAQVNGLRGETSAPELMRRRVEADIWYAKNASILLDIRILLMTVVEVLRQRNAY